MPELAWTEAWVLFWGILWTFLTLFLLLSPRGHQSLKNPRAPLVFGGLLALALFLIWENIRLVEALAGGQRILDARLSYDSAEVLVFAEALGQTGRMVYAVFQLSFDTLAPPAFACFVASVGYNLLPPSWLKTLRFIVCGYLGCVLPANALMPVLMLNYPGLDTVYLQFLLSLLPWLDFLKYSTHGLAWLLIGFYGCRCLVWGWGQRRKSSSPG